VILGCSVLIGGGSALPRAAGQAVDSIKEDEALLNRLGLATDGNGLLQYFRERTFPDANPEEMARLIKFMGSADFPTREKAYSKILSFGSGALYSLKKAKDIGNAEIKQRIHQLLQRIEENANPVVQAAVARLIAARKPPGAVAVLVAYLPFAADETVIDEMRTTLTKLAVDNGQANPDLVAALKSKLALTRRVAGEALAKARAKNQLPAVRVLLKDPDAKVRLGIALALADAKEADVLPVLIELLSELPPEQLWQAENILVRLAADKTPEVSLGTDEASRKKARDLWKAWYDKQDRADLQKRLVKLDDLHDYRGYTLVVYQGPNRFVNGVFRQGGREVEELDAVKDKIRWNFPIFDTYPVDAQVIAPNRVLLVEYNGRRISLRDNDGRILKKGELYLPSNPHSVQKLGNGNIFVVMRDQLAEYDRSWSKVWSFPRPQGDIARGAKMPNGTVVYINNFGAVTFLNAKTLSAINSFNAGNVGGYYGGLDVLPNGNVLIPLTNNGEVVEFTPTGQIVWRARVPMPTTAVRLPNGDVLVGSFNTRNVVQLNRQGGQVWSRNFTGNIYRVRVY
jgi:HEAT repeat protein